MLLQHAIASGIVRKRARHAFGHPAENDGHARDATRRVAPDLIDELFEGYKSPADPRP